MIEVKGHNGQITFDGQYITITRRGFLARATIGKGEKRIHISHISSVQWKPAGPFVNGFIQFSAAGGNERRSQFGHQTSTAVKDENSVVFMRGQQAAFEELRTAVEAAVAAHHQPAVPGSVGEVEHLRSVAERLAALAELHDKGLITDDDFNQQKNRILRGI